MDGGKPGIQVASFLCGSPCLAALGALRGTMGYIAENKAEWDTERRLGFAFGLTLPILGCVTLASILTSLSLSFLICKIGLRSPLLVFVSRKERLLN